MIKTTKLKLHYLMFDFFMHITKVRTVGRMKMVIRNVFMFFHKIATSQLQSKTDGIHSRIGFLWSGDVS